MHFYKKKAEIMWNARTQDTILLNETLATLLPDLSKQTLEMRVEIDKGRGQLVMSPGGTALL